MKFLSITTAFFIAAFCWSGASAEEVLREVSRIALSGVEGRIDHLSADVAAKRVFVAALGNQTVEVLDVDAGKVVTTLKGFKEPQGILAVPGSTHLLVTNAGAEYGSVLDRISFTQIAQIPLPEDSDNVRYDSSTRYAWIGAGSGRASALVALDTATDKVVKQIPLRGHPESFQLENRGPRIFVNVPTAGIIEVIDRDTGKVLADWSVSAAANFPMALDEESQRLFVGTRSPARLLVYEITTGKTIASLDTVGDTDDVFYDADTHHVYVSGGEGLVYVYRQETADRYSLIEKITTRKGARTSLFVPDWRLLFVALPKRGGAAAEIRVFKVAATPSRG